MRKVILATLFLLSPLPCAAATVDQIRAAIENFRDTHAAKIVARQEAYLAAKGRYWQGVITPAVSPDNGAFVTPDYTRRPTDQAERWSTVFSGPDALPSTVPAQISVDVYDGPLGKGWTLTVVATKAGVRYWRTWSVGPEDRATNWQSCTLPCGVLQ